MHQMISAVALLAIVGNLAMAGGDIAPVEPIESDVCVVAADDAWRYSASFYMWAAGISGESARGGDIDISFGDIIENLDFTFMGNATAQKGKWGLQLDLINLAIGSDLDTHLGDGAHLTSVKMNTWIATPMFGHEIISSDRLKLNLIAGARYLYMEPTITISPLPEVSTSGSVWDGIIGIKGRALLSEKWFMPYHFDIGTGDTDLTWQAFAGVGYTYGNYAFIAGYRHLEWHFNDDDKGGKVYNDLTNSGPIFGVNYQF